MTVTLTSAIDVRTRRAPSRVVFGPHETNLGQLRAVSGKHAAYYARRARGGSGLIVIETASVHPSDWPYERAPLAADCATGWSATAAACHAHGALVVASIGHAGLQGSSAFSQHALWAPSPVPDPATREMPMVMGPAEIELLLAGFAEAALSLPGRREPPRPGQDHSHRGRRVALGMPSLRVPAKPCDSSPLAAAR